MEWRVNATENISSITICNYMCIFYFIYTSSFWVAFKVDQDNAGLYYDLRGNSIACFPLLVWMVTWHYGRDIYILYLYINIVAFIKVQKMKQLLHVWRLKPYNGSLYGYKKKKIVYMKEQVLTAQYNHNIILWV